jgi:hypothetical protein
MSELKAFYSAVELEEALMRIAPLHARIAQLESALRRSEERHKFWTEGGEVCGICNRKIHPKNCPYADLEGGKDA